MPKIVPGIRYPDGQLQDAINRVANTPPQAYLDEIKKLVNEVNDYIECLDNHGFLIDGIYSTRADQISATKKIVIS